MLGITDLKTGVGIVHEGAPHIVVKYEHSKMGRGGAVLRTKLRNLATGAIFDITFKGSDKFDEAILNRRNCSFLYRDGEEFAFMDSESFEQFSLTQADLGDKLNYLKEGVVLQVLFFDEKPVSVELPIKMELEVTHTEPGIRGDTAQGGSKPATLETGVIVTVPLFVKIGDVVRVNTVDGTYVERVKQ